MAVKAANGEALLIAGALAGGENVQQLWDGAVARMSRIGAAIRNGGEIAAAAVQVWQELQTLHETVKAGERHLYKVFRLRDMLQSQFVYLNAMCDYMERGGKSRGSALYTDPTGSKPYDRLPDIFCFSPDNGSRGNVIQEVRFDPHRGCTFTWREARAIPQDDDFFENVWRGFRENGNIY